MKSLVLITNTDNWERQKRKRKWSELTVQISCQSTSAISEFCGILVLKSLKNKCFLGCRVDQNSGSRKGGDSPECIASFAPSQASGLEGRRPRTPPAWKGQGIDKRILSCRTVRFICNGTYLYLTYIITVPIRQRRHVLHQSKCQWIITVPDICFQPMDTLLWGGKQQFWLSSLVLLHSLKQIDG